MMTRRGFGSVLALLPAVWLTPWDIVSAPAQQEISYATWCSIGACFRQAKSGPNFWGNRYWHILYQGKPISKFVDPDADDGSDDDDEGDGT